MIQITGQDQINEKNIALIIKGGKLTGKLLAKAIKAYLDESKKASQQKPQPKNYNGEGKQTVKQLTRQGQGVTNIEISDKNIKSFEGIARKYGVDFAVKKDRSEMPPKWLVFFKGRDADVMTAAFKEYSTKQLKRSTPEKPSVIENLNKLMEKVKNQVLDLTKNKDRGRDL